MSDFVARLGQCIIDACEPVGEGTDPWHIVIDREETGRRAAAFVLGEVADWNMRIKCDTELGIDRQLAFDRAIRAFAASHAITLTASEEKE